MSGNRNSGEESSKVKIFIACQSVASCIICSAYLQINITHMNFVRLRLPLMWIMLFPFYTICSDFSCSLTAVLTNFDSPCLNSITLHLVICVLTCAQNLSLHILSTATERVCVCACVHMFANAQACVSGVLIKIVWELMLYSCSTAPISTQLSTSCQVIRRANTRSPASAAANKPGFRS